MRIVLNICHIMILNQIVFILITFRNTLSKSYFFENAYIVCKHIFVNERSYNIMECFTIEDRSYRFRFREQATKWWKCASSWRSMKRSRIEIEEHEA